MRVIFIILQSLHAVMASKAAAGDAQGSVTLNMPMDEDASSWRWWDCLTLH
jgi:hypothetical protein